MRYKKRTTERPENLTDFDRFQPCWSCANCSDICPFIGQNKPVDGWHAIPNTITQNLYWANTYKIIYCPNWKPDKRHGGF